MTARPGWWRNAARWVTWFAALGATAAALGVVRGRLDKAHVALAFLLVVLGGSAVGGRALGLALAAGAFVLFDTFFVAPFNTLVVADLLDWLVLVAFLITSVVAAQLFEWQRRDGRRREEAEALRHADRLKDALLATVSHDLRTPLTAIKGIAHEIWTGGDPERAEVIEAEADRLSGMVDDLLELSQLSAGARQPVIGLNTADDVVGAAVERIEATHGAGRIVAEVQHDGEILVGTFDFAYTMRALTNLLENAVKYSPRGGPVLLRCAREGPHLVFRVEDEGAGIPAEDVRRLFEPFQRGHRIPDGVRGVGLGLSIAKQLVEAQGGTLTYSPRATGGSRFTVVLPAGAAPPL